MFKPEADFYEKKGTFFQQFYAMPNHFLRNDTCLKAKMFALGEWYSCRRLAFAVNSGIATLGFEWSISVQKSHYPSGCHHAIHLHFNHQHQWLAGGYDLEIEHF